MLAAHMFSLSPSLSPSPPWTLALSLLSALLQSAACSWEAGRRVFHFLQWMKLLLPWGYKAAINGHSFLSSGAQIGNHGDSCVTVLAFPPKHTQLQKTTVT